MTEQDILFLKTHTLRQLQIDMYIAYIFSQAELFIYDIKRTIICVFVQVIKLI